MASLEKAPRLSVVVHAAFFVSGFTSLVLEVVWSKALALVLGSTLHAVSTVVAVYLGGLALGAFLAGRMTHRLKSPLVGYGVLEVCVGLYALFSLALLRMLEPLLGAVYSRLGGDAATYVAVRAIVAGTVLLPPTVLMGASLPWLVAWTTAGRERFARSLARLYGVNTMGAVAGAVVAGFWLVPGMGLAGSLRVAGLAALAVGAWLIWLGRRSAPAHVPASQERAKPEVGSRPPRWLLAALLFGASGAIALTLEITWTRVFGLIFGSSVYSFSLVLAAYLLGVALGSTLWGGRVAEGRRPWRAFGLLQGAVAAGSVVGLWMLPRLPQTFMTLLLTSRDTLPLVYLGQATLAGLVVLLPCLALGVLFPVGARLLGKPAADGARTTGLAYAVNTAGTLAGTLLAGFVLLPTVGIHVTLIGVALASLALGAVALVAEPSRSPGGRGGDFAVASALVLVAAGALLAPRWDRALFTLGVYRHPGTAESREQAARKASAEIDQALRRERMLFYEEGLHSVVSVHEYLDRTDKRTLRVNGKADAGTGDDMATQIMLGHLPMLWAPPSSRACVIGLGAGVTARAVLAHDPASLTIVEIERAVVEAARLFSDVNEDVLDDPRVEVLVEDGRTHLQHSGRTYDMIVSEPSNPWIAGVNNLFTTDFYRQVDAALSPEGVFCQWIQFYALSQQAMASLLGSFAEVFPAGEAFMLEKDLLLIAPPSGGRVPAERLLLEPRALEPGPAYVARFNLQGNGYVTARHLGRVAHAAAQLPAAPLNTDDRPFVEFRAPFDLYSISADRSLGAVADLGEKQRLSGLERWVEAADLMRVAREAGIELARSGRLEEAAQLAVALARRGAVEEAEIVSDAVLRGRAALEVGGLTGGARAALDANELERVDALMTQALALDPDNPEAHLIAARAAMRRELLDEAREHIDIVLRWGDPTQRSVAYNNLGIVEMRTGRNAQGLAAFEAARACEPGAPTSYLNLARWYVHAGEPDNARLRLEDGLRRAYPTGSIEQALEAHIDGQPF